MLGGPAPPKSVRARLRLSRRTSRHHGFGIPRAFRLPTLALRVFCVFWKRTPPSLSRHVENGRHNRAPTCRFARNVFDCASSRVDRPDGQKRGDSDGKTLRAEVRCRNTGITFPPAPQGNLRRAGAGRADDALRSRELAGFGGPPLRLEHNDQAGYKRRNPVSSATRDERDERGSAPTRR
jgi:hypothetical protein